MREQMEMWTSMCSLPKPKNAMQQAPTVSQRRQSFGHFESERSLTRHHEEDEDEGRDDDDGAVDQEARREEELLELFDGGHGLLFRTVERDHGGADDAQEAADLAEEGERLFEEDGGQDGADDHREGPCAWRLSQQAIGRQAEMREGAEPTQRSDENGVGKSVGDKVANLSQDLEAQLRSAFRASG